MINLFSLIKENPIDSETGIHFIEKCCSIFDKENNIKDDGDNDKRFEDIKEEVKKEFVSQYNIEKELTDSQLKQLSKKVVQEVKSENYYELRETFNKLEKLGWELGNEERAFLFLYLNKNCWNGLCRYSVKDGKMKFNVPFANYAKVNCPAEQLVNCSEYLNKKNIEMCNMDFVELFDRVEPGDMIYCDPPYIPLSKTASFTAYAGKTFSIEEHHNLLELSIKASEEKNCKVVISNSDCSDSRSLYKGHTVEEINTTRFIGGGERITELLVIIGT